MSNVRNFVILCGLVAMCGVFGGNNKPTSSSASAVTPVLSTEEVEAKRVRDEEERKAREAAEAKSCKMKWQACTDNTDLVDNYKTLDDAKDDCKHTANNLAKYGDPKWERWIFSKYRGGNDAPRTGIITLADDEVRFQNAFGTYGKSQVICEYSLSEKKVVNVIVE
jgi:hypothetical protein